LSYKKGIINKTSLNYFLYLPLKITIPPPGSMDEAEIINRMLSDKKNREGRIKFILIKDIGEILIEAEAGREEIIYAVQKTFIPHNLSDQKY
jgi:3-dehydroquinate synthetase